MIAHFDKATTKWFREHPHNETTVMKCDKCGSCEFSKPTNWGSKPSKTYVECIHAEHTKKYCKNDTARKRAKTTPACKCYKERGVE